jgi:hypothetical protein
VTGPAVFLTVVGALLLALAAVIVVDKRRPLRQLDDLAPPADQPGAYLGDGDLDRMTDERIAAESRLHRRQP